jgi:hypothetical protein
MGQPGKRAVTRQTPLLYTAQTGLLLEDSTHSVLGVDIRKCVRPTRQTDLPARPYLLVIHS